MAKTTPPTNPLSRLNENEHVLQAELERIANLERILRPLAMAQALRDAAAHTENDELHTQVGRLQKEVSEVRTEVINLGGVIAEKDVTIDAQKTIIESKVALLASQKSETDNLTERLNALKPKIDGLQKEIGTLKDKVGRLSKSIVDNDALVGTLNEKLGKLEQVIVEKDKNIKATAMNASSLKTAVKWLVALLIATGAGAIAIVEHVLQ